MTARILNGNTVASRVVAEVRAEVTNRIADGHARPNLAVVLVGDNPASKVYVRNKRRMAEDARIKSSSLERPSTIGESELLDLVDGLNEDVSVHGMLVQLPLPPHIRTERVIERIDPRKDVDGFHPFNMGRLAVKLPALRPCTPYGCMQLLGETGADLVGKHAVVIGQSNIVGRPMALELLMARCTVTICHSATRDLARLVRDADIVVAGVGKALFVKGEWIKDGAIVIDVGINRTEDGMLCGDVEFTAARERAGWITPVPGGVGPMTVAMLLNNTLAAQKLLMSHERRPCLGRSSDE
jgi:methylenetetrahydrofolate dehydrogenase (NADP+)/methenyltetrahydrofolate cyclohydrolase